MGITLGALTLIGAGMLAFVYIISTFPGTVGIVAVVLILLGMAWENGDYSNV